MAGSMTSRSRSSPKIRIAAAFISWVVGAACLGGVFVLFHGWSEGKGYLVGTLCLGVLAFIAHAIYIRAADA